MFTEKRFHSSTDFLSSVSVLRDLCLHGVSVRTPGHRTVVSLTHFCLGTLDVQDGDGTDTDTSFHRSSPGAPSKTLANPLAPGCRRGLPTSVSVRHGGRVSSLLRPSAVDTFPPPRGSEDSVVSFLTLSRVGSPSVLGPLLWGVPPGGRGGSESKVGRGGRPGSLTDSKGEKKTV